MAERLLTVEGDMHDEIPVSATAADDIVDQVTEYLSPKGIEHVAEAK